MTAPELSISGQRALSATVTIPAAGAWIADLEIDTADRPSGAVVVRIGALELRGNVDERNTGSHLRSSSVRVVAGANGWANVVPEQHYHNDAGVSLAQVVKDLGTIAGETVVTDPIDAALTIGFDYARRRDFAGDMLAALVPNWWVDSAGVTHTGPRPTVEIEADYQILDFDPRHKTAVIATEAPEAIVPGAILRAGLGAVLDVPMHVHDVTIVADATSMRVLVWCSPKPPRTSNRLFDALTRAVESTLPRYPFAFLRRYRVINMTFDRVALQAVRRVAGLPDVLPITVWPGVPGSAAQLAPGGEVLVAFVDGDPGEPIVTHFAPKGAPGFKPVSLAIDAGAINLGAAAGAVLRHGDTVQIDPGNMSGVVTGVVTITAGTAQTPPAVSRVKA